MVILARLLLFVAMAGCIVYSLLNWNNQGAKESNNAGNSSVSDQV